MIKKLLNYFSKSKKIKKLEHFDFFNILPSELKIAVFKQLPLNEMRKLSCVCKDWKALLQHPLIYPRLVAYDLTNIIVKDLLLSGSIQWTQLNTDPKILSRFCIYEIKLCTTLKKIQFSLSKRLVVGEITELNNNYFGQIYIELKLQINKDRIFTYIDGFPQKLTIISNPEIEVNSYQKFLEAYSESVQTVNHYLHEWNSPFSKPFV